MKEFFENIAYIFLVAFVMFIFGLFTGSDIASREWRNNCDKMGKHLSSDKVYFCFPEGGK